ncbi:MAG: VWA domain-containing protein [Myxococcales bacterium]|nr:VWA domain-containing protein [Myxococcales bacterium]
MTIPRAGGVLAGVAALSVVVAAGCNCGGPPPCKSSGDCGPSQVCLQTGQCVPKCSSDSQCLQTERCSTAGGCVARGRCGADTDCTGDKVCGPAGSCIESCRTAGCPGGQRCNPKGHCEGTDGGSCGELFEATPVLANFLVDLDKSGSMSETVAGRTKWSIAVDAVKQVTAQQQASIRFGLQLFPGAEVCKPAGVSVQVADSTAPAIATVLDATAPGGKTPIGGVLNSAATVQALSDPNRANYVMLVTDGKETCSGSPVTAVKSLFSKGIRTYVIGFGGAVDPNTLTTMAIEGGTARATTPRYYQADDAAALQAALASIAQGALGCDFKLAKTPPDASQLYVYVNGQLVTRDAAKVNGWEYFAAGNRVTLYGPTCDAVAKMSGAKVQVVYGCPDDKLVEGGGGGGPFDAGYLPRLPAGSACSANEQCASAQCTGGVCAGGKPDGSICSANSDCASGLCQASVCTGVIN